MKRRTRSGPRCERQRGAIAKGPSGRVQRSSTCSLPSPKGRHHAVAHSQVAKTLPERSASSLHSSRAVSKLGIGSQLGTAGGYVRAVIEVETRMRELAGIALRALPQMYDGQSSLFSQKALPRGDRLVNRGQNAYYSAASMVGILAQPVVSPETVIPVGKALDALHAACDADHGGPLLSTTLWAGALAGDPRSARLVASPERPLDGEQAESAALGQVLRGLVAGADAFAEVRDGALDLAQRCAAELLDR